MKKQVFALVLAAFVFVFSPEPVRAESDLEAWCNDQGENWSYGVCTVESLHEAEVTGTLTILSGETLGINEGCNIENYGIITINNGGTISNLGTIYNNYAIINRGSLQNNNIIHNRNYIRNWESFYNYDTIYNSGKISNQDLFENWDTIYNNGTIENDNRMTNHGYIYKNMCIASVISGNPITNFGVITDLDKCGYFPLVVK